MNRIFMRGLGAALAGVLIVATVGHNFSYADEPAKSEIKTETKAERDARMKWWREARFGMFIHWGLYSVPAGTYHGKQIGGIGEWIMNDASIPVAEYAGFAKQFNPVHFDADRWVSTAKNAGMKYIVITAKHHDGFAMFKSNASSYNIVDATPFARDPLKELSEACRKQGIKLGFYYSQAQDWHHPGGGAYRAGGRTTDHWDPAQKGDMDEYVKKVAVPQVHEILSNYGPVAVLWWDTPVGMTKEEIHLLYEQTKLQPGIITNNRLGGDVPGDTETPEQFIPATGYPGRDWETCMTLNNTWGFKSYDNDWKSPETLIRNLVDIASKGGNYLLNVGPNSLGEIPAPSIERLKKVGEWLKVNGEAIYDTSASPFKKPIMWGRATQKPGKVFLHVFAWPKDGKLKAPLANKVNKAYLLAAPDQALTVASDENGVTISLPETAPDAIASVIALEIDGAAEPIMPPPRDVGSGPFTLAAGDADITGDAKLESKGGGDCIGYWFDPAAQVHWTVKAPAGTYQASIDLACDPSSAGSEFNLVAGGSKVKGKVEATNDWADFKHFSVGELKIDQGGLVKIGVEPINRTGQGVMNLRSITLTPAK